MPLRLSERKRLRTIRVPQSVTRPAHDAAHEAIEAHVFHYLGAYHGNLWELAVGCYMQGLFDAAQMAQEYPGWPAIQEEP